MTGSEFRRWRRNQEISQQVVAEFAKCNKSTICRWEQEKIKLLPDLYVKVMEFYQSNQWDIFCPKNSKTGKRKPV